ncbi:SGNH/GDSL hydrolase family protein [Streptomyces sp. NPDC087226]|uniref:SGNH/GDSL hydrolase family protein n=1 Tax=Streptomyces sp. NPDC087226 TaxID=3365771 RepID=UPI0037F99983
MAAAVSAVMLITALPSVAAGAVAGVSSRAPMREAPGQARIQPNERDDILGAGWRTSEDRAWTTSGDARGLHILVANARSGYGWRTAATLSEPGFETDQWIGNACLTGSGRRVVVAYAPRSFTNRAELFSRGAFTATVDLETGTVTKLPVLSTLAYYSPGCGADEAAVVTQEGQEGESRTRLIRVDAESARTAAPVTVTGQVTSAVPVRNGIVAADVNRLVRIDAKGKRSALVRTASIPFKLVAGSDDGITYLDRQRNTALVRHLAGTTEAGRRVTTVATGRLADVDLTAGARGTAYVTGRTRATAKAPSAVHVVDAPKGSRPSSGDMSLIVATTRAGQQDPRVADPHSDTSKAVNVRIHVMATGKNARFTVIPGADVLDASGSGRAGHPKLKPLPGASQRSEAAPKSAVGTTDQVAGSSSNPVEEERTCAVPRNDPRNQALQPKPRQVEWAVDQAVRKVLTVQREANWKGLGMPAYTPQGLFPPVELNGGGFVPAQIMLGITSQESNLWQATGRAMPGVTGNPLIGNFYGRDVYNFSETDDWDIRWDEADCGYGIMQVTDRMRLAGRERPGEVALPYQTQRAVALDFAANIAAGLQILQRKWNETRQAGLVINNGQPQYLENWYFAIWAYNSGFYPDKGDGSPWGVGWHNNPANPHYPANRSSFLDKSMADAAHPQDWPYQEKVLGFAGHPMELPEAPNKYVAAYRPAWWPGDAASSPINRTLVQPPPTTFCDASNDCVPGGSYTPDAGDVVGEPAGPCAHKDAQGKYDLRCWYHGPKTWKSDCSAQCGRELLRFDPGYAYQTDGASYPPYCSTSGVPSNAILIDNVGDDVPSIRPDCPRTWSNGGAFTLDFGADPAGLRPSKIDFHQFGSGFGGHFWSAHTRGPNYLPEGYEERLKVSGTWKPAQPIQGWTRIKVFIPETGAWTRQATYIIHLGNGRSRHRVVNQAKQANGWVDLGVFPLSGPAGLSLSTETPDGRGDDSIVFDAAQFIPTSKPSAFYVAMGDSYSSGEGLAPYQPESDYERSNGQENRCHRSQTAAYPTQVKLPGHTKTIAQEAAEGTASFAFIACSGARTTDITTTSYNVPPLPEDSAGHTDWEDTGLSSSTENGELPQVDQGYLDEDTSLVTVTAGGNDVRFAEVMRSCTLSLDHCFSDTHKLTRDNGAVDPEPLRSYEKWLIRERLPTHLKATYQAIHDKAPNAQIIVLGYPQLFPDRPGDPTGTCVGITPDEQHFLNVLAELLNITITKAVDELHGQGINITFVNATQRWREGVSKWPCTSWTQDYRWSNPGMLDGTTVDPASFHPTALGQEQLADLVSTQLRGPSTPAAVQQRILTYVASRPTGIEKWTVTPDQALTAARLCLDYTRRGGVVGDPCMTNQILFVTTHDAAGAAINDAEAMDKNPLWVQQNYASTDNKSNVVKTRSWMDNQPYQPNPCPVPRGTTTHQCDEFPFYTSELGAVWDKIDGYEVVRGGTRYPSESSTQLKMIPSGENRREGTVLSNMLTVCRTMTSGTYAEIGSTGYWNTTSIGSPYLTVPINTHGQEVEPQTFYVC